MLIRVSELIEIFREDGDDLRPDALLRFRAGCAEVRRAAYVVVFR